MLNCTCDPNALCTAGAVQQSHCCGFQADEFNPSCDCVKGFVLLLTLYVYSPAAATFRPLPSMPAGVPGQLLNANKALQAVDQGNQLW